MNSIHSRNFVISYNRLTNTLRLRAVIEMSSNSCVYLWESKKFPGVRRPNTCWNPIPSDGILLCPMISLIALLIAFSHDRLPITADSIQQPPASYLIHDVILVTLRTLVHCCNLTHALHYLFSGFKLFLNLKGYFIKNI